MLFLLVVLGLPVLFFGTALTAKYVSWCLMHADLINFTLTFGQGCWIALAIFGVGAASLLGSLLLALLGVGD